MFDYEISTYDRGYLTCFKIASPFPYVFIPCDFILGDHYGTVCALYIKHCCTSTRYFLQFRMAAALGAPLWLYLMTRDTSRFACYNPGQYTLNLNHENDRMCLVFIPYHVVL